MNGMLFNAGSLMLVALIASYTIYNGFQKKNSGSARTGMLAAAAYAISSGLAFGTIAALSFDLPLVALLALAVAFGLIAGALGGMPYGMPAAVRGGLLGTIAAMLGTVAGSLFFGTGKVVLVAALLFVGCVFLVQRAAERGAGTEARNGGKKTATRRPAQEKRPSYRSACALGAIAVLGLAGILLLKDDLHMGAIGQPLKQTAAMDDENDMQVATIDVTGAGFAPKVTEFRAKTMIKVIFNVKASAGNGLSIVSKDLNFSADVKAGQNIFLLNNPQPGDYEIEVGGKQHLGTFTVKPAPASQ